MSHEHPSTVNYYVFDLIDNGLMKLKQFSDSEAEIIGFEELHRNQNEATLDHRGLTKRGKK